MAVGLGVARSAIAPGLTAVGVTGAERARHRGDMGPAGGALVGSAVAGGAYRVTGHTIRLRGKRIENRLGHLTGHDKLGYPSKLGYGRDEPLTRSRYNKLISEHNRAHKVKQGQRDLPLNWYRNYPKELPAWRHKRFMGHVMSGKGGVAAEVGLVGGSGLLGATLVRGHRQRHGNVGKRLAVETDRQLSPVRTAEAGVGLGAVAWGLPRTRMVGRLTERGRPGAKINTAVEQALRQAEAVRTAMVHSTEPLGRITGRGVGRMPRSLRMALERVPRHLRPATTVLAGAILTSHATPVRRTRYTAVNA